MYACTHHPGSNRWRTSSRSSGGCCMHAHAHVRMHTCACTSCACVHTYRYVVPIQRLLCVEEEDWFVRLHVTLASEFGRVVSAARACRGAQSVDARLRSLQQLEQVAHTSTPSYPSPSSQLQPQPSPHNSFPHPNPNPHPNPHPSPGHSCARASPLRGRDWRHAGAASPQRQAGTPPAKAVLFLGACARGGLGLEVRG